MPASILHPRYAEPHLTELLVDSLVVLIHGPCQWGRIMLARRKVGKLAGYAYINFYNLRGLGCWPDTL